MRLLEAYGRGFPAGELDCFSNVPYILKTIVVRGNFEIEITLEEFRKISFIIAESLKIGELFPDIRKGGEVVFWGIKFKLIKSGQK